MTDNCVALLDAYAKLVSVLILVVNAISVALIVATRPRNGAPR